MSHGTTLKTVSPRRYTGYTQKNGAVPKVNKKFISHLTRAQRTPSAAATVQISYALPAVRFSCLLRVQFPRWRRSRKRLSVCSVLRCPDLWLQCSVSFMHGLEKTHHAWGVFSKPCTSFFLVRYLVPTCCRCRGFFFAPDNTQWPTTVGKTPLDDWSTPRTICYLTTHNIHKIETSMPPAGFEPAIPASERSHVDA